MTFYIMVPNANTVPDTLGKTSIFKYVFMSHTDFYLEFLLYVKK